MLKVFPFEFIFKSYEGLKNKYEIFLKLQRARSEERRVGKEC